MVVFTGEIFGSLRHMGSLLNEYTYCIFLKNKLKTQLIVASRGIREGD